jgi:hypothetical protein
MIAYIEHPCGDSTVGHWTDTSYDIEPVWYSSCPDEWEERPLFLGCEPNPYFRCLFVWEGSLVPWSLRPPVIAGVPMFNFRPVRMLPSRSGKRFFRQLARDGRR